MDVMRDGVRDKLTVAGVVRVGFVDRLNGEVITER